MTTSVLGRSPLGIWLREIITQQSRASFPGMRGRRSKMINVYEKINELKVLQAKNHSSYL
jgi:hypothetical protein